MEVQYISGAASRMSVSANLTAPLPGNVLVIFEG